MTKLTDNGLYAAEVPQDESCQPSDMTFANFYPHASKEVDEIIWIKCNGNSFTQKIPPGSYEFLFCTESATEEDAASVVQLISNGRISGMPQYRRYDKDPVKDTPAKCWTRDPRHSLETLLRSKNLDPKNNYAVIQKTK